MRHGLNLLSAALAAVALAGCGDEPQTLRSGGIPPQTPAFHGTGMPYADPGWKAGDKVSWEQHLKTRIQQGQNDYARIN
jgi:hypothetical protein